MKKATAPLAPVAGIAAGTAQYGPTATVATPVAGYIPTAFTSFATKGNGPAVITFSGNVVCTAAKPTADVACPIEILVDGQKTGKVNFAPATADTPAPAALVQSVTLTTVLQKGGHTVAVQYLGSSKAVFTLKGWNLAVQAYPQLPEDGADHHRNRRRPANSRRPGPTGGLGGGAAPAIAGAAPCVPPASCSPGRRPARSAVSAEIG